MGKILRQIRSSWLLGCALVLGSLAAVWVNSNTSLPWLQLVTPVILTLSVLWWLRLLYLWQRQASFQRRERRRKKNPAEKLDIPAGVKKPEHYDGGKTLHEARWTYIGRAEDSQGKYFAGGIVAAILPPLALFLLSFHLLALPAGGSWAVGLILSEILCLIVLVYLKLTGGEPTAEWIESRLRAELFRREQFLSLAGVGPYLLEKPCEVVEEALRRRGQIKGSDAHELVALVPMQERSGLTWLEALHHRGSAKVPGRSDCIDRMESYLHYRIGKQSLWFANEIRDLQKNEELWSHLLTGSLLAAIVVAGVHAFHLYAAHMEGEAFGGTAYSRVLVGALAIVLPPLGTAFLGIRKMYNFRGSTRTYEHERRPLETHGGVLEALIQQSRQAVGAAGHSLNKIDFDFRAIALRTEQSLSHELEQWMLLMERREHEGSS